jgi:lipopolysaccharide transport system ATP-binding protein
METVISVKNLGKKYQISHERRSYVALRDKLAHPIEAFKNRGKGADFWALRDVSFDVKKGEVLGIIGANGAGKSTLLKILSRITPPAEGEVRMTGTVSSLLEVGTGFHPELTGRENIYLNGAILGMKKSDIESKFSAIVEFSGVQDFLDTPVKRYSSGMQVRLAFAVAAHLEPDILIIDEVLAVGDAAFQKKSLGRMEELSAKDGRTILFVSHNLEAVRRLCTRSILLDKGRIKMIGPTSEVIEEYLRGYDSNKASIQVSQIPQKKIQIIGARVINHNGEQNNRLEVGKKFSVEVDVDVKEQIKNSYVGVGFIDLMTSSSMLDVLDVDTNSQYYKERDKGRYSVRFDFADNPFNQGAIKLFLHTGTFPGSKENIHKVDGEIVLNFIDSENFVSNTLDGKRSSHFLIKIPSTITKI